MKKGIQIGAFLLVFLYASAQQEQVIESILVKGKSISRPLFQTSQTVQIITREEILQSPASSIEEVLSYQGGVDIRQRGVHGAQADVSIRGSSFEQVLVLVNGIRMNDSKTGHNMMNLPFDLAAVERIEIIKGPAARRFGQNAFAGVINIVTQPSGKNELMVSATGGEYGTYSLGSGINLKGRRGVHFLQAGTHQSEGYRYNTDYLNKNVWYQNRYQLSAGSIGVQAGIVEKKFGANGFFSSPSAREQFEHTRTSLVSSGWEQRFGRLKLTTSVYWRRAEDEYRFIRSNPSLYRNLHIVNNVGADLNGSYSSRWGITGLGVDLRKEYISSNNLGWRNRSTGYFFMEHRLSFFNDRLDATPGISFSEYSDFGGFWYPGIDAGYFINDKNKVFMNIGKTYRIPTYTDLYYSDPVNEGNPQLKPEEALSYELGYRFKDKYFYITASLFRRESKSLIDWVKIEEVSRWRSENVAKVNLNGVEASIQHTLYSSFISSYSLDYTYLDNQLKESVYNSQYSLDNLRHQLIAKLEMKFTENITNQLVYRYNDRVSLEDYHLLDDRLMFKNKKLQLFVQVNNLLNIRYTEANLVPMPGRWVQAGITFTNILD